MNGARLTVLVTYRCRCGIARTAEKGRGRPRCTDCGRTMTTKTGESTAWVKEA